MIAVRCPSYFSRAWCAVYLPPMFAVFHRATVGDRARDISLKKPLADSQLWRFVFVAYSMPEVWLNFSPIKNVSFGSCCERKKGALC